MTRGLLISESPFVAETARLVADELVIVARPEDAAGDFDYLFGDADSALAQTFGAVFVPIESIGLTKQVGSRGDGAVRTICLHGPESTGKSVMAQQLADRFDTIWVPEYGRAHCEVHGTDLDEAALLLIGKVQDAMTRASLRRANARLFVDTDPLMTAAWCEMMLGYMPDALFDYPKADLYLMLEPDVAWQGDTVRIYGDEAQRTRFADICRAVLDRAGVRWTSISGDWQSRFEQAAAASDI